MDNLDDAVVTAALFLGMVVAGGVCMILILLVSIVVEVPLLVAFLAIALVSIVGGLGFTLRAHAIQKKKGR